MIIHTSDKYPAREVLYRDYDYLDKVRSQNESGCKVKGPLPFQKQLSRDAKVYTHLGFYHHRGEQSYRTTRKSQTNRIASQMEQIQSPNTLEPFSLSNEPPQILSSQMPSHEGLRTKSQSSCSSQASANREKHNKGDESPILLYDGSEEKRKDSYTRIKVIAQDASVKLFNEASQRSLTDPISSTEQVILNKYTGTHEQQIDEKDELPFDL